MKTASASIKAKNPEQKGEQLSSSEISILDMHDKEVVKHAKVLGVRSVPTVAVNGKLAECCANRGPNEASLRAAGVGQAL